MLKFSTQIFSFLPTSVARRGRQGVLGLICLSLAVGGSAHAKTLTWNGGAGADGFWGNSANWGSVGIPASGDTLIFQGTTRLLNTNSTSALVLNQIIFQGATGGFDIRGAGFTITNGIIATNTSGTNTIENNIELGTSNILVVVSNGVGLTLEGTISGVVSAGVNKAGSGSLTFQGSGNNTYSGTTLVTDGTLLLNVGGSNSFRGKLVIGDGTGTGSPTVKLLQSDQIYDSSSIMINDPGILNLNNFVETIGPNLTMSGGEILTGTGTLSLANGTTLVVYSGTSSISGKINVGTATCLWTNTGDLTMNASVSGSASITKAGAGNVYLTASNSYTGVMTVNSGFLWCSNSWALGTTNGGTVVNGTASLVLAGSIGVTNEALTLNGAGTNNWGALDVHTGTNIWAGPVTLNTNSTFNAASSSSVLRINGAISGSGGVELEGSGTHYYDGTNANTYAGVTTVSYNTTLMLNKTGLDRAIPNNLYIYVSGAVRLAANTQITNSADVYIDLGGLFDCGTYFEQIDTLRGPGSLTFGVNGEIGVGLNNGSSTFDGVMSGTGYTLGGPTVAKKGSGTFTMNGDNTFTAGSIYVYSPGKLVINGSQPQSPVLVNSGATLAGSGTVGNLMANGNISPGNSPGILTCSNLTCTASGTFSVELTGVVAGTGYDQLNVRGTNTLAGATLTVFPLFSVPIAMGQQFTVIKNDGADPIVGTFNGLPNGATNITGGFRFKINYSGGDGNDVVLTLVGLPGAVAGSSVTSGNGNHAIDANECNNLNLVIANLTGIPMTGVTGTLYSTTLNVMITQPESAYPNVAASGTSTNTTPFQISTLPGFICGSDIHLVLAMTTASHSSFSVPVLLHTGEAAAGGLRYDVNIITSIPDTVPVESTNNVVGFTGPLEKVAVAFWLQEPVDTNLDISLISPDGTTVVLVSDTGMGPDFGTNCSPDSGRTTFDDAAPASITAAFPPFTGIFRPQGSLASFNNGVANGNWRLHIKNNHLGSIGMLRCWSLFLYPLACAGGGGFCGTCPPAINGSITGGDPVATGRIITNSIPSSCVTSKIYPGTLAGSYHFDIYNFTNNSGADACITVGLTSINDVESCAYLPAFNPANVAINYAGDAGASTGGAAGSTSFSFDVPAGSNFLVTITEMVAGAGVPNYTLLVSGLLCPPPSLHIQPVTTNQARLFWPSSAGGYSLKSKTDLVSGSWNAVTNEPIINSGSYNVTNNTILPVNRFYHLEKP